jgi:multidrug efflux pump subunit AcrA (membrane-fusion protein)
MNDRVLASIIAVFLLAAVSLAGCGSFAQGTPTPLPTVMLDSGNGSTQASLQFDSGGVIASGTVVPGKEARMAFTSGGNLESVEVAIGDQVEAGQVLARLSGAEQLQASLSGAELEILTAEQALQKLNDDLPEEQTAALQALNEARDALRDAQQKITGFGVPPEQIDIDVASSNVALAKRALEDAKKDFQPYANKPENDFRRATLLSKLAEAQEQYDNAVKQLNRMTGVFVPEFDMAQAQTELEIAQARLKLAEDRYALLQNGPDPAEVELIQARIKNAQDQAAAVRASLDNLEMKAPFAGTVSQVNVQSGEWVIPGQAILALADLENLRIETTDLSENDIPRVEVGQLVTVLIEALNQEVSGVVSEIAPLADTLGGDVVYKTTIDLDSLPPGLRAGMSAEVQFGESQ